MRILWLGPWRYQNLSDQCRSSLSAALMRLGHAVHTAVIGPESSWPSEKWSAIHYLPEPRHFLDKALNQLRLFYLALKFPGEALILGEKLTHLVPLLWLCRLLFRRPWLLVVDVRTIPIPENQQDISPYRHHRFWLTLRLGLRCCDGWTPITPRLKESVAHRIPLSGKPSAVIPSGVEPSFCERPLSSLPLKQSHSFNLFYSGSLYPGRQLDFTLRAVKWCREKGLDAGLHLFGEGPSRPELEQMAKLSPLEEAVHFYGAVPFSEVSRYGASCDAGVLALPNLETWNVSSFLKLFDYMAAGLPLIVSDIPAHRDLLKGQPFAFFIHEFTETSMAEKITEVAAMAPEKRRELGLQARQWVLENHTWDHRAQTFSQFLEGLRKK